MPDTPHRQGSRPEHAAAVLEETSHRGSWAAVVWNDPVNLMSYVVHVLRTLFGYGRERAGRLMLQIHKEGRATVAHGNREEIEADVHALHAHGLRATIERAEEG